MPKLRAATPSTPAPLAGYHAKRDFTADSDGEALTIPGIQLIGYVSTINPASPGVDSAPYLHKVGEAVGAIVRAPALQLGSEFAMLGGEERPGEEAPVGHQSPLNSGCRLFAKAS